MIYLIGGPARCGKSSLAARVRKYIDGQVLSGDAFVHSLQENLQPAWMPDIYEHTVASVNHSKDTVASIDRLRRRDERMWLFYKAYIDTAIEDAPNDDLLLEGNLWPDFLELFSLPHKAVFLVDTSPSQLERLRKIRDGDSDNNWMTSFTDARLESWAGFNAMRSQRYVELCQKTGYQYFDIATLGIEVASDKAYDYLLEKVV